MVMAVVVPHEEYQPSEELAQAIRDYTKDKLAGFKRPGRIDFIADDQMPRTGTGKIVHRELRIRYGHWADN
jgi:acyl-coenzyme A synthetase/AMP-(fatty) acid ligase